MSDHTVVWTTPSRDSKGSMPIGNGDIGANVWIEHSDDSSTPAGSDAASVVFFLSKTDAWSENGRLLKLGRIRVALTPNPFRDGCQFSQTLDTDRGEIMARFKMTDQELSIRFAVDANHPVVTIDLESTQPVSATVSLEHWRTQRRTLTGQEAHSAYGLLPSGEEQIAVDPVVVEPDTVLTGLKNRVVWYHRNERSKWKDNLELQALGDLAVKRVDPLLHRTFGALIEGEGMVSQSDTSLRSAEPAKCINIAVYPLTAQTKTAEQWLEQLDANAKRIRALSLAERIAAHRAWWSEFWDRSDIRITTNDDNDTTEVDNINRGYRLQRFVNACGGRGAFPIKFNGSIFTTEGTDQGDWDADYRRWGGGYWWQNTRLPYWSMLESGDFDLMMPLFQMFLNSIEGRKAATRKYYDHDGAFYPETQTFWGSYMEVNYGRERAGVPDGLAKSKYIRYYWQGGLELSLMMLDYFAFTGDEQFARDTMLPLASEILTFFDQHWKRDSNGKIRFDPAMALETYRTAINPLVEIVGIHKVCEEMLALPEALTAPEQRTQWKRLITELPPVPTNGEKGEEVLAPAESYSEKQNSENPELYGVFPYRRYGVGKPELELARRTFASRASKGTGGWQQNAIKAACLGLAGEAAKLVAQNFSEKNEEHRFPVMWGPNYDWVPDQDHGAVSLIALQRMLLQYDGDVIHVLPAWPKHWDVDFKLHAPRSTTVECRVRGGTIVDLKVTPDMRRNDIVTDVPVANDAAAPLVPDADQEDLTYYGPEKHIKPIQNSGIARAELPTAQQLSFMDLELGLFIHYGLSTYTGQSAGDGEQPASRFNPTKLDCDSWMETAKAMGATYAVLTARHEGGFCAWPTKSTEYCVRNSPWKDGTGDVVAEYVDACRRHGIKVGLYHTASHDAHHRRLLEAGTITEEQYQQIEVEQITELFTQYGPITYIWQDHHSGGSFWKRIDDTIAELQPDCVRLGPDVWLNGQKDGEFNAHVGEVFHPLWYGVNTTDGTVYARPNEESQLYGHPRGEFFRAWEANTAITGNWFWNGPPHPSSETMLHKYYNSVGMGANLLLNFAPDPSGKMPDTVLAVAKEFGDTIHAQFANPLGSTNGMGKTVELDLGREASVATVVTMEGLTTGQRIAGYAIEAEVDGAWIVIASDQTVGHKKIDRLETTVRTRRLRFVCRMVAPGAIADDVVIRELTAYGS